MEHEHLADGVRLQHLRYTRIITNKRLITGYLLQVLHCGREFLTLSDIPKGFQHEPGNLQQQHSILTYNILGYTLEGWPRTHLGHQSRHTRVHTVPVPPHSSSQNLDTIDCIVRDNGFNGTGQSMRLIKSLKCATLIGITENLTGDVSDRVRSEHMSKTFSYPHQYLLLLDLVIKDGNLCTLSVLELGTVKRVPYTNHTSLGEPIMTDNGNT